MQLTREQEIRLDRYARSLHKTPDEAASQLLEEGLRHAEFPAIEFRDSIVGRQAYVRGTGLTVWEVMLTAEPANLDPVITAEHLLLEVDSARQAIAYAAAYPVEIQQALEENRSMTFEKLREILPGLTKFDIP